MTTAAPTAPPLTRADRYRRCMESLVIRAEDRNFSRMRFSQSQEILWSYVAPVLNRRAALRFIVCKARQTYSSTFFQSLMFTHTIANHGVHSLVIAHDVPTAHELLDMAKRFNDHLPLPTLSPPRVNELIFPFSHGPSRYRVQSAKTTGKGRGANWTCVHASECAYWPNPEIAIGVRQAVPDLPDTLWVLESTANGKRDIGQYFYEQWLAATSGDSDLIPVFIPWYKMRKYRRQPAIPADEWDDYERAIAATFHLDGEQIAWRRYAIKSKTKGSVDIFNQEFPICVAPETRVGTDRGLLRIDEASQEAREGTFGRLAKSHRQVPADLYRVTTDNGYSLRGTIDHPVFLTSGLLAPLAALKPGMAIQLAAPRLSDSLHVQRWRESGVDCAVSITESWGRLLGYFVGDGSFYRNTLSIASTAADTDVIDDIRMLLRELLDSEATLRMVGPNKGGAEVRVYSAAVKRLFDGLGLLYRNDAGRGQVKRRIAVPDVIWRSPRSVVREFLRGLFEADGFNAYGRTPRIVLFSKHRDFLADVQLLLLAFGITCRLSSSPRRTGDHAYTANELTLAGARVHDFLARIGFVSQRKSQRPSGRGRIVNAMSDTVARVARDGVGETYDFTIEGGERFDANGLLTHNTPEVAFISSGTPAFDQTALTLQHQTVCPPKFRGEMLAGKFEEVEKGTIRLWAEPKPGVQYVIGADTAEGLQSNATEAKDTRDYAAACVLDMRTLEQVASIHGYINPWDFAETLNTFGRWYNDALLAVEINNHGHTVQDRLIREFYYPALHRWRGKPDRDLRSQVTRRLYGWECLAPSSRVLTSDLRWVCADQLKVGDRLLGCRELPRRGAPGRMMRIQTITERRDFLAPMCEVLLENGQRTAVSATHPFLVQGRPGAPFQWMLARDLQPGMCVKYMRPWNELRSYDAGRLSAFLDGEGHLSQGKPSGLQMLISQAEGPLADEIQELWTMCGFDATFKWVRHKKRPHEKPVATSGVIRLPEVFRALGSLRPTRLLRRFAERVDIERLTLRSLDNVRVARVLEIGDGPVIGLTTDPDHTLIADGIVSHNTNSYSRPLMIDAGRRVINTGQITIHEEKLIEELANFSMMDNGKYEAEYGHDDRCVALLIALRSREENYVEAKLGPTLSDVHPFDGIRVVDHRDVAVDAGKRADRIFKRVKDAVTSYLEL